MDRNDKIQGAGHQQGVEDAETLIAYLEQEGLSPTTFEGGAEIGNLHIAAYHEAFMHVYLLWLAGIIQPRN